MRRIFNGNFKVTQKYHTGHKGMDIVGLSSKNIISPVAGIVKSSTIITNKNNITWEWGNYVRVDDALFLPHGKPGGLSGAAGRDWNQTRGHGKHRIQ